MEPEKKSNGALVGLIIIIIILVIGGIYIWQSNETAILQNTENPSEEAVSETDSAELDALEQDLETVDTDIGIDINTVE